MIRSLYVLPLAALLAAGYPALTLAADDVAEQCRKMAAEDEVAPEDMDEYIAECLAVIQSESADDAAQAMDRMDSAAAGEAQAPKDAAAPKDVPVLKGAAAAKDAEAPKIAAPAAKP